MSGHDEATTFYGRCRGGPYNTKNMVHHLRRREVAIDTASLKSVPGLQAPSTLHFDVAFGVYRFDDARKEWDWIEPETTETVDN